MGAVYPWAWLVLALASAGLVIVAAILGLTDPSSSRDFHTLRIPLAMAVIVFTWIWFQSVEISFPDWNAALWVQAEQALGSRLLRSISLDRERSLNHLLRLLSDAAVFLTAWNIGRRPQGAAIIARMTAIIGTLYALYGLVVYFAGNTTILWYRKWAYAYDLTATFVNRNSFATFAGLCLLSNLGLMALAFANRVDARSTKMMLQSSLETAFRHGIWLTLGLSITASALLLTHSRGGIVATLAGAVVLIIAILVAPSLRGPWRWPVAALTGFGAMVMVVFAGAGFLSRVSGSESELSGRTAIYQGTLEAISQHPLLGTGLGSFQYIFPPYQPWSETKLIEFAHNDYLENALDLGIPMALVFYATLGILLARCMIGVVIRRRNAIYPCIAIGASALVICHSAIDFSMQVPAVSAIYVALLGVGVAQSVGSTEHPNPVISDRTSA